MARLNATLNDVAFLTDRYCPSHPSQGSFGGFISILLIFPLWMWFKSRKERERLAQAISMADQRRKQEADRIMRLADLAPEKLTRAERAAVEGKAAWRESVSTWRESVTTAERSIDSMIGARPSWQDRGSMSSNGAHASRESSKICFATTRPRYRRTSSSSPTPLSLGKPVQEITEERNNALQKLMGGAKPAPNRYASVPLNTSPISPPDSNKIDYLRRLTHPDLSETAPEGSGIEQPVSQGQPTSIPDPSRFKDIGDAQGPPGTYLDHLPPSRPPLRAPVPTTMYGFHLPYPQAGRAYTMISALANSASRGNGHVSIPMHDRHEPVDAKLTDAAIHHQVDQNLPTGSASTRRPLREVPGTSDQIPKGIGKATVQQRDLLPLLQTTVLGPRPRSQPVFRPRSYSNPSLSRRPAQVRRPSAEVASSPRLTNSPVSHERLKSSGSSLSLRPSLSSEGVGEFAKRGSQVGPAWHRERMQRLHESVRTGDLSRLPK
ncbi:hypothetical protein QFC22_000049 [Naganishia vaughanmartiniae]|uniref:Uncharacterized protein n=1 Tax=Naganishia vaughanmartiniae TaxID=1424756 RepID=A0ACC2XQ03_9TREE|nr:hypothetical protein QFC22_000049 [Naganishia vaughanmartiniae]